MVFHNGRKCSSASQLSNTYATHLTSWGHTASWRYWWRAFRLEHQPMVGNMQRTFPPSESTYAHRHRGYCPTSIQEWWNYATRDLVGKRGTYNCEAMHERKDRRRRKFDRKYIFRNWYLFIIIHPGCSGEAAAFVMRLLNIAICLPFP